MDVPYTAWQDMSIHFIESYQFPLKEILSLVPICLTKNVKVEQDHNLRKLERSFVDRSTFLTSACIFFLGHEDYYDHTAQELYGPVVSKYS